MEVYKLEESEEEVTVLVGVGFSEEAGTQQGANSRTEELPRVLNLEKESNEHFQMDPFGTGAALH